MAIDHLFVIPGHGAGDPGAGGHGYSEAERVRALATKIKQWGGDRVTLADFSRNYYADKGINSLTVGKNTAVVELHMDSAGAGARGGHVIIQGGLSPDAYDKALAEFVSGMFPGRSITISRRTDLANPNRARNRGINYRLVENGFISDAGDVETFNSRLDELAKGYLTCAGLPLTDGSTAPSAPSEPSAPSGSNSSGNSGTNLLLDCDCGKLTVAEWARQLGLSGSDADGYINHQYSGNRQYLKNMSSVIYAYDGTPSPFAQALQRRVGSSNVDGILGKVDVQNVQRHMNDTWGYHMLVDGYFGPTTAYNVQHSLNLGLWAK